LVFIHTAQIDDFLYLRCTRLIRFTDAKNGKAEETNGNILFLMASPDFVYEGMTANHGLERVAVRGRILTLLYNSHVGIYDMKKFHKSCDQENL
jgi:hypothetical protein